MLKDMDKKKVNFIVRVPQPVTLYYDDVPTLDEAIALAKEKLNDMRPGSEVKIYQLVRIVRTPLVAAEEEEFASS